MIPNCFNYGRNGLVKGNSVFPEWIVPSMSDATCRSARKRARCAASSRRGEDMPGSSAEALHRSMVIMPNKYSDSHIGEGNQSGEGRAWSEVKMMSFFRAPHLRCAPR